MRTARAIRGCLFALLTLPAVRAIAEDEATFNERVMPVVKKFCVECHAGSDPEAGLSFDTVNHVSHVDDHPDLWEDIAEKLRRREMPPVDQPQPSADEFKAVETWIAARMAQLAAAQKPNPGRVTMRRLNRFEYNNTIRDLVGVDFHPADDFPADDTGYGFDNIGDVLSLPPLLMEKYLAAAEQIIDKAIVTSIAGETIVDLEGTALKVVEGGGRPRGDTAMQLYANGLLECSIRIPQAGTHEIIVKAFGDQTGPDPARMSVRIDGNEVRLVDVPATHDAPGEYVIPWKLTEGDHRLGLAFVNDYYNPNDPDESKRDRNLIVLGCTVRSADEAEWEKLPDTYRNIILRPPASSKRHQLVREVINRFAQRAFRRSVNGEEVKRLVQLYQQAEKDGATFEQAIRIPLTAILVSPHFLFRIEIDRPDTIKDGAHSLNEFELASRLSYFLWSSMPDQNLFEAARIRAVKDLDKLTKQVERMLDDPKSSALVESFAVQWLQLRKLGITTPDTDRFPGVTTELMADMRRETELFFEAVLRENRPVTDLLDADFTYVNERLAKHYGIEGVQGPDFRRVNVARDTRGGILTQASVLTLTSNPTRTSPVKRGKWVLENLLGAPPPPPPPGVPELPDEKKGQLTGTLRQRLEQHRAPNACGVCHSRIDPLGFGLENYDAVGRWRTHDGESEVDASGVLPDGSSFKGPGELKRLLVTRKDEFTRSLAEKMLTYALGRGLTRSDRPALDKIVVDVQSNGDTLKSMVLAVVLSEPFRKRSTEEMP